MKNISKLEVLRRIQKRINRLSYDELKDIHNDLYPDHIDVAKDEYDEFEFLTQEQIEYANQWVPQRQLKERKERYGK